MIAHNGSDFPELTARENQIIHIARDHGFAGFFPCYPTAKAQAENTLRAAQTYLGQDFTTDPEK